MREPATKMDERVHLFLREAGPVFCLDIGSGTQKALLARPGQECANWPRWILPSPARLVGQRIRELTLLKHGLWLYGGIMGSGFLDALRGHLAAGLPATATEAAARAIDDDVETVRGLGVTITETCPANCVPVHLEDFSPGFWESLFRLSALPQPHMILAAAQDSGTYAADDRQSRMKGWDALLMADSDPTRWIYSRAPESLDRLRALQAKTGGPVADTATCAILGALCDAEVLERSFREGITIINAGNEHILAALVYRGRVCGLYEHHTERREPPLLLEDLRQLRLRWLPTEDVHASGGHGAVFGGHCEAAGSFAPTYLLGPRRDLLAGHGRNIAPYGDMPHTGCFGILRGWAQARPHS